MESINTKRLNKILSHLYNEMKVQTDDDRDLPIRWNVMHMYTTSQIAKIIALKRGLDPELAAIIAALHDIAVVKTKRTNNHAAEAKKYIIEMVNIYNNELRNNLPEINEKELAIIIEAVIHHSDIEIKTEKAYLELIKDVDVLDRYLHGIKTEDEYLLRCVKTFEELNLHY